MATPEDRGELSQFLVCPRCGGPLSKHGGNVSGLTCAACGLEYPVRFGVPIMLPAELHDPSADRADHLAHKAQQVAFSDGDPDDDFAVVRPRGAPALYGWLMRDKFRRSVLGLEGLLEGSTVLVVCGGSGMDAEFLVRSGARVILSDISLGAVLKAQERSRRFGLEMELVVADAESLPFRDQSVDVVYVHDGLHHLERPSLGIGEMARVARRAVSVTEPAMSFATRVAIRLGWAEEVEEAGNRVMRLTVDEIVREFGQDGFRPVKPHRYAMFYRHYPGKPMRVFSGQVSLPLVKAALGLGNRVLGRFGNKLTVQAIREAGVQTKG